MTIGTGFFGRSSMAENLQPKHLVQWTRLAYNSDPAETFGDFSELVPWATPVGSVPPYPRASNLADDGERWQGSYLDPALRTPVPSTHPATAAGGLGAALAGVEGAGLGSDLEALRAEIRRVIVEELQSLAGGGGERG
jgi:acetaldehyde dehydrogenase/alcohol dehydrogenase